jgi:hypothetical protein
MDVDRQRVAQFLVEVNALLQPFSGESVLERVVRMY